MLRPPLIVVMGVSGSGKSTVGAALAASLGIPFADADDLHPEANVERMAAGHPLTDEDRWPWLALVGEALAAASGTGLVMACSALRRAYRDAIRASAPDAMFVHLDPPRALLEERMRVRTGHYMPASLLESQLATLEQLEPHERGIVVRDGGPAGELVAAIANRLN